jgi:predicted deacetylase
MGSVTARLLVSLSGINTWTLDRGADLCEELATRGVPLTLLLAPRVGGADQPRPVRTWVREQSAAGAALLQHGCDQATEQRSLVVRRRAEFATLPAHEAGLRLTAAGAAMERAGLVAPQGFVPPRWLASPGTVTASRRKGFRLCADLLGVRDLSTGSVHRGRVLGFGVGERTEPWWCFALVMGAARTARRGGLVRLAVDTADLARSGPRQALLDAVDIALHHGARAVTYPELVTRRSARAA